MSAWDPAVLQAIGASDELRIAPFRADGCTPGTSTVIWSVVVDGDLVVRAYNGTSARWYAAAMRQKAGRIRVAGGMYEVTFEAADPSMTDAIDAAYHAKYAGSAYVAAMVAPKAKAATVLITPRG